MISPDTSAGSNQTGASEMCTPVGQRAVRRGDRRAGQARREPDRGRAAENFAPRQPGTGVARKNAHRDPSLRGCGIIAASLCREL